MSQPKNPSSLLRQALDALRDQLSASEAEIAALDAERRTLASAPPSIEDVETAIDAWTHAQAERYRRPLRELLGVMLENPLATDTQLVDSGRPWLTAPLSLVSAQGERITAPAVASGALCLAAGDLIGKALKAEARALLGGRPSGPPLAERRARLKQLDAAIASKRQTLSNLRTEAAAAGASLRGE